NCNGTHGGQIFDLCSRDRGLARQLAADERATDRTVVGERDECRAVERMDIDLEIVQQRAGVTRASQRSRLAERALMDDVIADRHLLEDRPPGRTQGLERVVAAREEDMPL